MVSISWRVSPDLRDIIIGRCSVGEVVEGVIWNASTSPILLVFSGSAVSGRSKAPFRVLWYTWFAVLLISLAMSSEETPPPSRSTFYAWVSQVRMLQALHDYLALESF